MHVLTLTPFYPTETDGARGCFVAEPLVSLETRGVGSTVLVARPLHRAWRGDRLAAPAVDVRFPSVPSNVGLGIAGFFLAASLRPRVLRLHAIRHIDVIHAHSALPCGHAARLVARWLGVPFAVTAHGLDVLSDVQVRGAAGRRCARESRRVYTAAAVTICVSERVRGRVLAGTGGAARTEVVHNGVDTGRFRPAPAGADGRTIVSVGDLIPVKGQAVLLRAAARLLDRWPGLRVVIVGDGPERSRLEALARSLGFGDRVVFRGRVSRETVAAAMAEAAVFALPSSYEGLGCVYLEAMASAVPVVACREQGIEDIVRHGANGWLVAPGDVDGLTEGLATLLGDGGLRARLGTAGRKTVTDGLTLGHQAERLLDVYRACAR